MPTSKRDQMPDQGMPTGGKLLTELSNAIVGLYRDHFGRGPGAARTFIAEDLVVTVLTDVYTQVEKTLVQAGKMEHVRRTRLLHQHALEGEFTDLVEGLTGRRVEAFMSTIHFDPDLAVEIFVLEPKGSPTDADGDGGQRSAG